MKKRKILNICMVMSIVVLIICGILAVGSVKGWFGDSENTSSMSVSEKIGIAMIERSGVAYELSTGASLREGDKLYTKTAASLIVAKEDISSIYMGANTNITLHGLETNMQVEVLNGETLLDARTMENLKVLFDEVQVEAGEAVIAVSKQTGSAMIYVYSGEILLSEGESEKTSVASGNVISIVEGSDYKTSKMSASSLSDEQIKQLAKCEMDESFCFELAELEKVQELREAEILVARQEAIAQMEEAKKANASSTSNTAEVSNGSDSSEEEAENTTTSTATTDIYTEVEEEEIYDAEDNQITESDASTVEEEDTSSSSLTCTIKIVCDTILDNMGNLTAGKEGYVPSSGTILGTTSVSFSEGETVFDVLQRVCNSAGIQLEYSWTPIYNSYYIEGLNHLYEFDCGNESGWMYKVNGWFPNYGCSSYYLSDGDVIVWCYTCNGLGADVGGTMY